VRLAGRLARYDFFTSSEPPVSRRYAHAPSAPIDGLPGISEDLLGKQYFLPLIGKKALMPPLGLITIGALTSSRYEIRLCSDAYCGRSWLRLSVSVSGASVANG